MNEEMAVSVGDVVRDKTNGRVGVVASAHIHKTGGWVIATQKNDDGAIIRFEDLELVEADPAPAGSDIAETVIVGQDKPAKPKPAENIVIGIDLKVSDEGKAMLDQLKSAAENAKAVGLTSGVAEESPDWLTREEIDQIKEAVLLSSVSGHQNIKALAYQLIDAFALINAKKEPLCGGRVNGASTA